MFPFYIVYNNGSVYQNSSRILPKRRKTCTRAYKTQHEMYMKNWIRICRRRRQKMREPKHPEFRCEFHFLWIQLPRTLTPWRLSASPRTRARKRNTEEIVLIECIEAFLSCLIIWIVHRWLVCEIIQANQFIVFSRIFLCVPIFGMGSTFRWRVSSLSMYVLLCVRPLFARIPAPIQFHDSAWDTIVFSVNTYIYIYTYRHISAQSGVIKCRVKCLSVCDASNFVGVSICRRWTNCGGMGAKWTQYSLVKVMMLTGVQVYSGVLATMVMMLATLSLPLSTFVTTGLHYGILTSFFYIYTCESLQLFRGRAPWRQQHCRCYGATMLTLLPSLSPLFIGRAWKLSHCTPLGILWMAMTWF